MTTSPQPRIVRPLAALAVALLGAGALTACGTPEGTGAGASSGDGPSVVASTSVYADIAEQVAGDRATVDTVISDPTADPHSYEASPADAAAVATADLVVYNGGGYDSFVDLALDTAGDVPVVRAVDEFAAATGDAAPEHSHAEHSHAEHEGHADHHGHEHGAAVNEHVWFSLPTAAAVARAVATQLATLDPEGAEAYHAGADEFADSLAPLEDRLDRVHDRGHFGYAQTERVGQHLFNALHLTDHTPTGFLSAIEQDTDPSAADLTAMLDLLGAEDHGTQDVAFLAYNPQTETSVTTRVRDEAEDGGVVVVEISETLPEGTDYLTWMTGIIDSVTTALDGATPADHDDH